MNFTYEAISELFKKIPVFIAAILKGSVFGGRSFNRLAKTAALNASALMIRCFFEWLLRSPLVMRKNGTAGSDARDFSLTEK